MRRRLTGLGAVAVLALCAGCQSMPGQPGSADDAFGQAGPAAPTELYGWVVDWRQDYVKAAERAVNEPGEGLTAVDEFRLHFDESGEVTDGGSRPQAALAEAVAQRKLPRYVTLVNDVVGADRRAKLKNPDIVHAILQDDARRAHLVESLRSRVSRDGYAGLDLDLENALAQDRAAYTRLVAELAAALHADGKRLLVTVHPQTKPETRNGPGAQDLAAIAASADEVLVMAYHVHYDGTEPGPSAPWDWLNNLIRYNARLVPPQKLSIALYAGGWQWSGGHAKQVTYADAIAQARALDAKVEWSEAEHMPHFSSDDVTVWFENACSLLAKTRLVSAAGLRGVALWHLGKEDPAFYAALKRGSCDESAEAR